MSAWYNAARTAVLLGQIDFSGAPIQMVLVDDTYTFNANHAVTDLAAATVAGPITVTVVDVADNKVTINDVTFPTVADGDIVSGAVAYVDDGTTQTPVAYIDRRADTVPIKPTVGNGGALTFVFDYLVRL